ncbi:hypothetical protein [uncultured Tateyamaria sp.]|uniref:capsular polysaccharide export protein, LipB/KpsS family n=1 Tax=uncultured Tateyamaria sp. TaxID=455651 RepID=UPI0026370724|nr:hypothetical protein [uncultured Tateyamaria sp.]
MTSKVILHLSDRFTRTFQNQPYLKLHARIYEVVTGRGGNIEVRSRDERLRDPKTTDWSDMLEPDYLHIIENGLVQQPGTLNTTLAYLPPFYHLDPQGVLARSSAGNALYDPATVDTEKAQQLWDNLQRRFVEKRWSRYDQPQEHSVVPKDCIAIFLQGDNPQRWGTAHCDPDAMVRAVATHAEDRPVVIKAHPSFNPKAEQQMIHALQAEGIDLIPTNANIHDILHSCAATVSFNSAVAIEGFLHNKPAILFGRSDFHHVCETVTDPDDFSHHLSLALTGQREYKPFLHWYFNTFCLSLDSAALDAEILGIFADQGFPPARLGLRAGPWEFEPAATAIDAAKAVSRYLKNRPGVQSLRILEALKFSPKSWVFTAKLNGEKVVIKRFFNEDRAHTVRSLRGELNRLEQTLANGDCQANRCLMAWPEDGIAILSHAPGPRLDKKIAGARGRSRQKLLAHSGRWLATYTSSRRRDADFGPGYWIKQLLARDHSAVEDPASKALLKRMISSLRKQNDRVKGCHVVQAASHGDFVGMNAHYHRGTIYGVDIQGECWIAIAREAALFLVWLQMHDPDRPTHRIHGIKIDDVQAFLSSGVLSEDEQRTTLPFFIGTYLYRLYTANFHRCDIRSNLEAAILAYLVDHPD